MKRKLLYALVLVFALSIGYLLSWLQKDSGGEVTANVTATKSQTNQRSRRRTEVVEGLTQLQRNEGGEQAWLRWVAELENAEQEDLPRFLDSLPERGGVALDLLAERWLELGPEKAWQYFVGRFQRGEVESGISGREMSLVRVLIRRWADIDLDGVVAAIEQVDQFPYLEDVHRDLAPRLARVDPERGLRYALRVGMNRSGYYFFLNGKPLQRLIDKDPRVAAELIFEWDEQWTQKARRQLIKRWGQNNPEDAIQLGLERGDAIGKTFADEAFVAWAQQDYEEASAWVAEEASEEEASLFIAPLVDVWAKEEPVAALQWAQEQLAGSELQTTVTRLVLGAVEREDVDAGELLRQVQSPESHSEAALALAEKLWGSGSPTLDGKTELERLAWFDHVTDRDTLNQVIYSLSQAESEEGQQWLSEFVRSEKMAMLDEHRAESLIVQLQDEKDFGKSFELLEFVDEACRDRCTANLFDRWFASEPEAAAQWLEEEPVTPVQHSMIAGTITDRFFSSLDEGDLEGIRQQKEKFPESAMQLVREGLLQNAEMARLEGYPEAEIEQHIGKVLQVLEE